LPRYLTKLRQTKPRLKPQPIPTPNPRPKPKPKPRASQGIGYKASQGILAMARPDNAKEGADFDLCALHAAPAKSPLNESRCFKL